MVNKVHELKAKLAKAEEQEKNDSLAKLLKYHTEHHTGKAFVLIHSNKAWKSVIFTRYYKFKLTGFGDIEYSYKAIQITTYGNIAKGYSEPKIALTHRSDRLHPGMTFPEEQVDMKVFNQVWKHADVTINAAYEKYSELSERKAKIEEWCEEPDPESIAVDTKYIQLESPDTLFFPKSPFLLPGHRYLITPNSVADAKAKLRAEEEHLDGGSHLYEACDMNYVNGKYERISRIRLALEEACALKNPK